MIGLGSEPIIGSSKEASRRGTWQQQISGSGMLAAGNDWDTRWNIIAGRKGACRGIPGINKKIRVITV
ncbi:hypothetical protein Tco_1036364 [Tanacetum coccineum]